jgi:hypothetical protein
LVEQQRYNPAVSSVVQQALGKLNVRMADLMEQMNVVITVLVNENTELRTKLANVQTQTQQQSSEECVKK